MTKLIPGRESVLATLKKIALSIGYEGLDLLQSLLNIDPDKRINATDALSHQFLKSEQPILETGLDQFYRWEMTNRCDIKYMSTQVSITEAMRSILIDWLIDVSVHFEVTDDTLHLTVGLIDRALAKLPIDRSKLQLVGVTCMKIADILFEKSKEYYRQENSIEYAYITADEYTPAEVVKM